MVGTEEDAARAYRGEMLVLNPNPHGDRTVYRDPGSATVYKVDKPERRHRQANAREHANAELFAECLGVPPTSLYAVDEDVVLAMPYCPYPLAESEEGDEIKAALDRHFGPDLHAQNMRKDAADKVWFIDLVDRRPNRAAVSD